MKGGACLIGEARCGIPSQVRVAAKGFPEPAGILVFQEPVQRHGGGAFGALVCPLWDVGPGFLMSLW